MPKKPTQGCSTCSKATLSILLLRPSPVAKHPKLVPEGALHVHMPVQDMAGILPARVPTESRFALRLLRSGYVHVYIPSPPSGVAQWSRYRVTEDADLIAEDNALFNQPEARVVCAADGHNAMGLKLLPIAQAHLIPGAWIGFSANLWDATLRATIQKSLTGPAKETPAHNLPMQYIDFAGGSPCTFKPSFDALRRRVLECTLRTLRIGNDKEQDFPFTSVSGQLAKLVEMMAQAAACHEKTNGKELAVILADPVAIAAELNSLRLRRSLVMKAEMADPRTVHAHNSMSLVDGLKNNMVDASNANSLRSVSPLLNRRVLKNQKLPPGAKFVYLNAAESAQLLKQYEGSAEYAAVDGYLNRQELGRIRYADQKEREQKWAAENVRESWDKIAPYYDEEERQKWERDFQLDMKVKHYEAIARMEEDWWAATTDGKAKSYFACHFRDDDPNDPTKKHSPGLAYARESDYIHQPAPICTGPVLNAYLKIIDGNVLDKGSVALRAIAGNDARFFKAYQQLITPPNADVADDPLKNDGTTERGGMRDKVYDILKEFHGKGTRYSWMGDAFALYSVNFIAAVTAAAMSATLQNLTAAQVRTIQNMWGFRQSMDFLSDARINGARNNRAPKMAVLITMQVSAQEALDIHASRSAAGFNPGVTEASLQAKKIAGERVLLTLLTDTDALARFDHDPMKAAQAGTVGQLKMDSATSHLVAANAGRARVIALSRYVQAAAASASRTTKSINALQRALETSLGKGVKAVFIDLEGRLAIGTMAVQTLGLFYGYKKWKAARPEKKGDAVTGILDSFSGFLGGAFQMMALGGQVYVASRAALLPSAAANAGERAVAKSVPLLLLKVFSNVAGIAGGYFSVSSSISSTQQNLDKGNATVSYFYGATAAAFVGTMLTGGASIAGQVAAFAVARGVIGVVVEGVATRLGAAGIGVVLGATITVSGIGLFLLVAGVSLQVAAIMLTPTELQRWISRSRFGKDKDYVILGGDRREDSFALGDWATEFKEFSRAVGLSATEAAKLSAKFESQQAN
ncbi:MAG: T6SS effector BTH_I2691 family protein [Telluria sp.]